jgi:hypothetical protein
MLFGPVIQCIHGFLTAEDVIGQCCHLCRLMRIEPLAVVSEIKLSFSAYEARLRHNERPLRFACLAGGKSRTLIAQKSINLNCQEGKQGRMEKEVARKKKLIELNIN